MIGPRRNPPKRSHGRHSAPLPDLPTAPDDKRLRAAMAAKYGRFCGVCGTPIDSHEGVTVWRKCATRYGQTTACLACGPSLEGERHGEDFWAGHCTCGRQVLRERRNASAFYCCDRHEWSDRNKTRAKPAPKRRHCDTCGKSFVPEKESARYCSNACRQRAYRARAA